MAEPTPLLYINFFVFWPQIVYLIKRLTSLSNSCINVVEDSVSWEDEVAGNFYYNYLSVSASLPVQNKFASLITYVILLF